MVAYAGNPKPILSGTIILATGVCVMHYGGMMAMHGPFAIEWNSAVVFGSILIAAVVSAAGLWILFRLLLWKVNCNILPQSCVIIVQFDSFSS